VQWGWGGSGGWVRGGKSSSSTGRVTEFRVHSDGGGPAYNARDAPTIILKFDPARSTLGLVVAPSQIDRGTAAGQASARCTKLAVVYRHLPALGVDAPFAFAMVRVAVGNGSEIYRISAWRYRIAVDISHFENPSRISLWRISHSRTSDLASLIGYLAFMQRHIVSKAPQHLEA
jgi:hypothetical protein